MAVQFSFIIPVYNCEPFLEECVCSIVEQATEKSYEILLVDDGSTDGSGDLCERLHRLDTNIHVLHKNNGGAASARNAGIEAASGSYLIFIDGDDKIAPDCLSELSTVLQRDTCLPVFGMAFDFWHNGSLKHTEIRSSSFDGQYSTIQVAKDLPSFFSDNVLSSACNKVFSASVIREHHLRFPEDVTLYEDFSFVLSYLMHINSILCIPNPFYHYRNDYENAHFHQRISDLEKLQKNLRCVNRTLLDFGLHYDAVASAASVAANLSLQMLSLHLLLVRHNEKELRQLLPIFCDESLLQLVMTKKPILSTENEELFTKIDQGHFKSIDTCYVYKRLKRYLRRIVKKTLRR